MTISDETIRLNKSFEGYHKKLANGDCTAYQTPLGRGKYDIPTCGYGTTEGVKMGMVWTEAEATERMMQDLAKAEAYVNQYVTVPINDNERGALTLFCNNCGPGNLKNLTNRLNKGDRVGTAKAFLLYNKAQGIVLPGLVSRRARESALFLKPIVAPTEPAMPQTVQKSIEPPTAKVTATAAAATTVAAQSFMSGNIPTVNDLDRIVSTGQRVRGLTDQAGDLGHWLTHSPIVSLVFILATLAGLWFIWKDVGIGSTRGGSSDGSN